jgi:hypothetical protein
MAGSVRCAGRFRTLLMTNEEFEKQWAFVLHHHEPHVRRIAERAAVEPILRALYPYASLRNLRFSTTSVYPFDLLPYVLTNEFEERYEARDFDNRPIAVGSIDVAVAAVVRAMGQRHR